jgi:type IV pilus assembly protein PilW
MKPASNERGQCGATLVELMVSMVVGLLIVMVASTMFLATRQTNRVQNDNALLQETGRYVLGTLGRELRMAGYRDYTAGVEFPPGQPPLAMADDTGENESDEITVRYFGSDAVGGGADAGVLDCLGNAVAANVLSTNRYYVAVVDPVGDPEPALWCESSLAPGAPAVLVTGVESLQLLYGEDTDNDGSPNRYAPAGVVNPDRVISVIVSVVVRGEQLTDPLGGTNAFNHFGAVYAPGDVAPATDPGSVFDPPDDRRPRRQFQFTVGLRNRIG